VVDDITTIRKLCSSIHGTHTVHKWSAGTLDRALATKLDPKSLIAPFASLGRRQLQIRTDKKTAAVRGASNGLSSLDPTNQGFTWAAGGSVGSLVTGANDGEGHGPRGVET
jgi:hypothetical protein